MTDIESFDALIKHWEEKFRKAIAQGDMEEAAFFARAVGNEWERMSRHVHDLWVKENHLGEHP